MDRVGPDSSLRAMLAALGAGEIGSAELVELHLERIAARDPAINAIAVPTFERAREAARSADARRAAGGSGPLLGAPMTLKESTQVAGLPQSAGIEALAAHRPAGDGPVASRLLGAGACLLGKTNVPFELRDWQADSPVYGRTNNPWDIERTSGGSTGGGGAAVAAGMTPFEIGSDIAGSIRVPAAFCGVYGHRPSETAVPRHGAYPLEDAPNPAVMMLVQGPLARSAFDLEIVLDAITAPVPGEDVAWRLELPPARHEQLADFRVAVMPPLSLAEPAAEMQGRVEELARFLAGTGATVAEAMPAVDPESYFEDYFTLLVLMGNHRNARREAETGDDRGGGLTWTAAEARASGLATPDALGLISLLERREAARAIWRQFFTEWDVLVCPAALDAAYPHMSGDQRERRLTVDGRQVPYLRNMIYPMWPVFVGHPATAFPTGLDSAGLPLGLQAIGPYLEDRTSLRFAQLLEREWRSFEPPPVGRSAM